MSFDQYAKSMRVIQEKVRSPYLKAMLCDCFSSADWRKICYLLTPKHLKMKWGWQTLHKYISYFPSSRFALFADDHGDTVCLTLIDKDKVRNLVGQHAEDFRAVLQQLNVQPEALSDNETLDAFSNLCCTQDELLGMILGFGKENARLYAKYKDTDPQEGPMVSAWSEEEMPHLDKLSRKDLALESWEVTDVFYPRFVCNPLSEETSQLKQTYRTERAKIVQYYEGKDIVEATLSLFNQG